MDELLQAVGISKKGTYSENGSYVIDIEDYDEYGKFYAILEKAQENFQKLQNNIETASNNVAGKIKIF